MTSNPLSRLAKVLAGLYPDVDSSILFMAEVGMQSGRILVEAKPSTRWFFIVRECSQASLIPAVLAVALDDYPSDKNLLELRNLLVPVDAPTYNLDKVVPPTETKVPLDRIVGGRITHSFPDCAAVGDKDRYVCSGTLISPTLVITARHCSEVEVERVFLNGFDLTDLTSGEVVRVTEKILHPTSDLMLLRLEKESSVPPRRIATTEEIDQLTPMTCLLVGWGTIDFDGTVGYGIKRRVEVPVSVLLSGGEDSQEFGTVPGLEMVAGHRGLNRDSCSGDSGGPLYIQDGSGEYVLLGVTSRGVTGDRQCGDGGVYVRADKFAEWVKLSL